MHTLVVGRRKAIFDSPLFRASEITRGATGESLGIFCQNTCDVVSREKFFISPGSEANDIACGATGLTSLAFPEKASNNPATPIQLGSRKLQHSPHYE